MWLDGEALCSIDSFEVLALAWRSRSPPVLKIVLEMRWMHGSCAEALVPKSGHQGFAQTHAIKQLFML